MVVVVVAVVKLSPNPAKFSRPSKHYCAIRVSLWTIKKSKEVICNRAMLCLEGENTVGREVRWKEEMSIIEGSLKVGLVEGIQKWLSVLRGER